MSHTQTEIFGINPALDPATLAGRFAATGRVQIDGFLASDGPALLRAELAASPAWRHIVNGGTKVFEIPRADFEAMPADQRAALDGAVITGAASGFQYRYDSIRVPDAATARAKLDSLLVAFARFMAEPAALSLFARITGLQDLIFADAQATRYHPGDFLTRHDDDVAGKHRRLAYVLGLTPGWQSEWGGLLLFNDATGGLVDAFLPRFNALSLFAVPQPHSVSYVAPFAQTSRLSVTGWIRSIVPDA
jgi:hypothetical protein